MKLKLTHVVMVLVFLVLLTLNIPKVDAQRPPPNASRQEVILAPLFVARDEVATEDAATLAACLDFDAGGSFDDMNSLAFSAYQTYSSIPSSAARVIELFICAGDGSDGDPENKTLSIAVVGYRHANGPAVLVFYADCIVGDSAIVTYPNVVSGATNDGTTATNRNWVDTMTLTSKWLKPVGTIDSNSDRVCRAAWATCGYEYFTVYFYNAAGTGAEAGDLSAYYSYYN